MVGSGKNLELGAEVVSQECMVTFESHYIIALPWFHDLDVAESRRTTHLVIQDNRLTSTFLL